MELALLIWFASVSTSIAKLFGTLAFVTFIATAFVLGFSLFYSFIEDEKLKIFEYKKIHYWCIDVLNYLWFNFCSNSR